MNESLQNFTEESIRILNTKKDELSLIKDKVTDKLKDLLKETPSITNFTISGRVKGSDSLREKIIRKNYFIEYQNNEAECIEKLSDIIGIRITCFLNNEEQQVYNNIVLKFDKYIEDKKYFVHKNQKLDDYPYIAFIKNKQPEKQKNGNDIFRIPLQFIKNNTANPINIELQIKSLTHMFWGELEHLLFYKNYAYTINSDFYTGMMSSINGLLKNIDIQLTGIKEQLSPKDDIKQIKELKEILAKLMYEKVHPKVKNILNTDIDLREVYTVITQLIFIDCKEFEVGIKKANEFFLKISSLDIKEEDFNFGRINLNKSDLSCNPIYFELIEKIDTLSKSEDLFWHCFLTIYKTLDPKEYTKTVEDISIKLMDQFKNEYASEIDEQIRILLNSSITTSIVSSFCRYKKIDFFIPGVHQSNISKIIIESIKYHQFAIEPLLYQLSSDHEKTVREIISLLIKIQLDFYLSSNIDTTDLRLLKELLDVDNPWNAWIDYELLGDIIEEKKTIQKSEELFDLLHYYDEKEDNTK